MATNTFANYMGTIRRIFFMLKTLLLLNGVVSGQDSPVSPPPDSIRAILPVNPDTISVSAKPAPDSLGASTDRFATDSLPSIYGYRVGAYLKSHPYFNLSASPVRNISIERKPGDTDWIFYLFTGLLFYLALLRLIFPKYFYDLFQVFFNTSMRQKQIREQLIQEPLPSMLLNLYFVLSGGVFLYFLLLRLGVIDAGQKWMMLGICVGSLVVIYSIKSVFLRFLGWILARRQEAEIYTFVVFMVNKVAGITLLPLAILLAVSDDTWVRTVMFFCWLLLAVLILYRLVQSYKAVYKGLKINQLHFILYVAGFEVIPLLIAYKVLINLFG